MGKKLVIKGADFSLVAIGTDPIVGTLTSGMLVNNAITIIPGDSAYGNYNDNTYAPRMTIVRGYLIPISQGQTITFTGLKGISGTLTALTMTIMIYNSRSNLTPSTLVGGSNQNMSSTDIFELNDPELSDTLTWTNTIGDGYLSFGAAMGTAHNANITVSNYSIGYTII